MDFVNNASFKRYDKICKLRSSSELDTVDFKPHLLRLVCCFSLESDVSLAVSMDLDSKSIARAFAIPKKA